jgi:hypothetical protein
MEMKDPSRSLSRRQEKNLLKAADALARTEFDTPVRTDCPGSRALTLLARRDPSLPATSDLIDHIGTCSPCFIEYSAHREAYKRRVRTGYALAAGAIAAVVCLAVALFLRAPIEQWFRGKEIAGLRDQKHPFKKVVLDLRMKGAIRGDGAGEFQGPTPRLPRARLAITIQLPVGSEDGVYDIAIANSTGQMIVQSRGEATFQNFIEILPLTVDLTDLSPGRYELRLRRAQTEWSSYSVVLE